MSAFVVVDLTPVDTEKLQEYLTGTSLRLRGAGEVKYSNLGAGLLGQVLMTISDKDYETLIQERICEPLNMTSTTTNRSLVQDRLVAGRDASGDVTSNWDLNALIAAGGIVSTVEDLTRFVRAQFDTTQVAMARARTKTATLHGGMDVALGWHIQHRDDVQSWHWHNGGTGGYRSYMAIDMDTQRAVVVLTNVSAFHNDSQSVDQMGADLLTAYNAAAVTD